MGSVVYGHSSTCTRGVLGVWLYGYSSTCTRGSHCGGAVCIVISVFLPHYHNMVCVGSHTGERGRGRRKGERGEEVRVGGD